MIITMMEKVINEEVLCLLIHNSDYNSVAIDYEPIVNPLAQYISSIIEVCDDEVYSLPATIKFLKKNPIPIKLKDYYSYCEYLGSAYQGVSVQEELLIESMKYIHKSIEDEFKEQPDDDRRGQQIKTAKATVKERYIVWGKAYALDIAYEKYKDKEGIIAFSHRRRGWSTPSYKLTENFSVEIKTNFGYGRSSYFYTKLKYKGIEITPFSEWTSYEFSKFWEITRYTKSHNLANKYWIEAMEFCKDACNLSIIDEEKFVRDYIMLECKNMVSDLELFLNTDKFLFKDVQKKKVDDPVHKTGRKLIEFRGEKVSGALEFISKILELKQIIEIQEFVSRIESCNRLIQPILEKEIILVSKELQEFEEEMEILNIDYDIFIKKNKDYASKKLALKTEMLERKKEKYFNLNVPFLNSDKNIQSNKLEEEFCKGYPEFPQFVIEFEKITDKYNNLSQKIINLKSTLDKIKKYNSSISKYFNN